MKIKLKLLFVLASLLLETSNLYAMEQVKNPLKLDQDDGHVTKRKMFLLTPDYRDANQILIIKELSSVVEFGDRPIVVTRLIDDSEVPFYQSTGINSGLPKVWLPFFGLWQDGWFHKNETFDNDHADPLYHSGCYVLAQVANELDRLLPEVKPSVTFSNDPGHRLSVVNCINCWIGGAMLDPDNMPQRFEKVKTTQLPQSSPIPDEGVGKVNIVEIVTTLGKNLFKSFKNDTERKKNVVAGADYFYSFLTQPLNSSLTQNPFVKEAFQKEMNNTALFVHDLKGLMQRMENFYSNEQNAYIKEYKAFKELVAVTLNLDEVAGYSKSVPDKSKAYLSLQMLKRFSFNYVYKMLNEVAKNPMYSEELYNRALVPSRAVWVMIKHNRKFEDYKRNNLLREKLLEIKNNNSFYFNMLSMEKPIQIIRFLNKENYNKEDTEVEEHIPNKGLLKNIRIKSSQIYETPDFELINIHAVIAKGYHKKSFAEIVEHYNQPNYLLGIKGVTDDEALETVEKNLDNSLKITQHLKTLDNENAREPYLEEILQKLNATRYIILSRSVIPYTLNELKQLTLDKDNYNNYIVALDKLLFLKNTFQGSDASQEEKESTLLYHTNNNYTLYGCVSKNTNVPNKTIIFKSSFQ